MAILIKGEALTDYHFKTKVSWSLLPQYLPE